MTEHFLHLLRLNTAWILTGYLLTLVFVLLVHVSEQVDRKRSPQWTRGDLVVCTLIMLSGHLGFLGVLIVIAPFIAIMFGAFVIVALLCGAVYLLMGSCYLLSKLEPVVERVGRFMSKPLLSPKREDFERYDEQ